MAEEFIRKYDDQATGKAGGAGSKKIVQPA
jgi:hypothetical protein